MLEDFEEVLSKIRVYGADWARQSLNAGVQNGLFSGGVWVGEGDRSPQPGCLGLEGSIVKSSSLSTGVWRSSAQSIPNATWTALAFDTELWDSDSLFSTSNNDRLIINHGGLYLFHGQARFAANATGYRNLQLQFNSGLALSVASFVATSAPFNTVSLQLSFFWPASFQDYFQLLVYQTSGVALNIETYSYLTPFFCAARLA